MKQWMMVVGVLLLAARALAGSWEVNGFYSAHGKLIRPGMTMQQVIADAGEPLERKSSPNTKPPSNKNATEKPKSGKDTHGKTGTQAKAAGAPKLEIWKYRRSEGVYSLIFGGGTLTRIDVTPSRDP